MSICVFEGDAQISAHCNSFLTSQDVAAKDLAGFVLVRRSSQFVSASSKKLALARILRSPNWSVTHRSLSNSTQVVSMVATSAKRKRCGDCRHTENGEVAERFVVCVKFEFNAQIRCFFRLQGAFVQEFQVWDAKFVVLAVEPYKGGSFVTSHWRMSLPAQALGPVKERSKQLSM